MALQSNHEVNQTQPSQENPKPCSSPTTELYVMSSSVFARHGAGTSQRFCSNRDLMPSLPSYLLNTPAVFRETE